MKSAIVPYKGNSSSVAVKPQQSMAIVPAKKESVNKAEVTAKDIRRNVLMLLRKRQQRDRLEAKFAKVKEASKAKDAARKEESKQEKTSFLTKVGSGIKGKAEKLGGNLFGALGDLLGFIALDWISKPENQQTLKGIVEGIGHIFSFVDWWVTGSVDNLMTGFSQLVGGDTVLERFVGFIKLVGGIFGLRYFTNPTLIIKDFNRIKNFIMEGGLRKLNIFLQKTQKYGLKKGLKFAFPKLSKVLQKVGGLGKRVLGGIKNILGKTGVGNLFKRIGNAIWRQGGGKAAKFIMPVMKKLLKPVTGFLKRIPVVGGLISFGVNLLFGDSLTQSAFKALGGSLGSWIGGGIGTLIPLPGLGTFLGAFVGGIIGDWLGNRFYEMLMKRKPSPVSEAEKNAAKIREIEAKAKAGNENLTQEQLDAIVRKKLKLSDEQLEAARKFQKESRGQDSSSATTTSSPSVSGNFDEKFAAVLGNYEGLRLEAYPDANYGWEIPTIGIGATYYPPGFRLSGNVKKGDTITEEEAYWIKSKHIIDHRNRLVNEVGADLYNKATERQKVALESVVFNYGSLSGAGIKGIVKNALKTGDFAPVIAAYREKLAYHNGGINSWRRNDEADIMEKGQGTRVPNIQFAGGGSGVSIPRQKQYRHSIMSQLSMEAVQARKFANRGGGGTVIIRTGAQTYANYTSVVNAPRVNSNTRMSQKRGL